MTAGEYHKQPIEPERIFREGEMGDFELWQNSAPSCSKGHGGGEGEVLPSLAAEVLHKARGERFELPLAEVVPKPEPVFCIIW